MEDLRFGVIGCGFMGRLHTSNASFVPGMKTVAYCDVRPGQSAGLPQDLRRRVCHHGCGPALLPMRASTVVLIQTGELQHPRLVIGAAQGGQAHLLRKAARPAR